MNSLLGRTVSFVPNLDCEPRYQPEGKTHTVKGTVIYVNAKHKHFTVSFRLNGYPLRECFKFCDIGKGVTLCG